MANRLAQETSPYLQQHADNPVDWYAWGEEAMREAREKGKPILLSIGYSACHWCHVMAHESFEDPATAAVMNDLFVNIKVDREERPDIDQIYQLAQALLTRRSGGWPLTMFLTPEQLPFFGGTYFPREPRYGLPGFADLLRKVREFYDRHPEEARAQGHEVAQAMERSQPRVGRGAPLTRSPKPVEDAFLELRDLFDAAHGGFGHAPKFPRPDTIEILLRRHAAGGDREPLEMATRTLRRMASGGIFDHVAGGFARYSVDATWTIPHFEKMLYDNAWLLRVYAQAWTATREPLFRNVCERTMEWVAAEMRSPEGAFYSSLDADSEGEEGKFYVWSRDQVRALLAEEEFAVVSGHFGLDGPPNFEGHAWHLAVARPLGEVASQLRLDEARASSLLRTAMNKLAAARATRVRPGRDEKVLLSWNALMVAGIAAAGRIFGREDWLGMARDALEFIRTRMVREGRLLATFKDGRAHLDAYLDDHAFLLDALLEMLQARFDVEHLAWAREIADTLLHRFHDDDSGGFFFTAHDHEPLIHRPKPGPDNATPSGNGVAARCLHRLAFLTGETRYSEAAQDTVTLFEPQLERQPSAFGSLLWALEEQMEPPELLVVRGPADAFGPWREVVDRACLPHLSALYIPAGIPGLPESLDKPVGASVNAWLCRGVTCLPPSETPAQLREMLELPKIAPFDSSAPTFPGAP